MTVLPNVVPNVEGNVSKARLNGRIVSIRNVNIPVEELQDHEKLCKALAEQSLLAIREDGAQAIVMGCTGNASSMICWLRATMFPSWRQRSLL